MILCLYVCIRHAWLSLYVGTYMCVCMYACLYVYVCMYAHMYVFTHQWNIIYYYLDILQEFYYYDFASHPVTLHTNLMRTNLRLIVIKTKNKCI